MRPRAPVLAILLAGCRVHSSSEGIWETPEEFGDGDVKFYATRCMHAYFGEGVGCHSYRVVDRRGPFGLRVSTDPDFYPLGAKLECMPFAPPRHHVEVTRDDPGNGAPWTLPWMWKVTFTKLGDYEGQCEIVVPIVDRRRGRVVAIERESIMLDGGDTAPRIRAQDGSVSYPASR